MSLHSLHRRNILEGAAMLVIDAAVAVPRRSCPSSRIRERGERSVFLVFSCTDDAVPRRCAAHGEISYPRHSDCDSTARTQDRRFALPCVADLAPKQRIRTHERFQPADWTGAEL